MPLPATFSTKTYQKQKRKASERPFFQQSFLQARLRPLEEGAEALSHAARAFFDVVERHAKEHGDPFCFVAERS